MKINPRTYEFDDMERITLIAALVQYANAQRHEIVKTKNAREIHQQRAAAARDLIFKLETQGVKPHE